MKCKSCNHELTKGKNFCTNCGEKIALDSPMQDVEYQHVENAPVINNEIPNNNVQNNVNNSNVINNNIPNMNQNNFVNNPNVINNNFNNQYPNNYVNNYGVTNNNINKNANVLCTISLLCHYAVGFVVSFFIGLFSGFLEGADDSAIAVFMILSLGIVIISYIASYILMVIARIKYKTSTFAKVLMWIYIVELILSVIGVIAFFVIIAALIEACSY